MVMKYHQPGEESITQAVDKLQQEVQSISHCNAFNFECWDLKTACLAYVNANVNVSLDIFYPLCPMFLSSSVVAVTTLLTGQPVCGYRQHRMTGWSLTAAAKPPVTTVVAGTIPAIFIMWRWVDHLGSVRWLTLNVLFDNCDFCKLLGRLHHQVRGIHPESIADPWCSGYRNCFSSGKIPRIAFTVLHVLKWEHNEIIAVVMCLSLSFSLLGWCLLAAFIEI